MDTMPITSTATMDRPARRGRYWVALAAVGALTLATATLGAGTAAADNGAGFTVETTMPAQLTPGAAPVPFTITAFNHYDGSEPISRYEFIFTGAPGLQADQLVLEYQEPGDSVYKRVDLSGATDSGGITGRNRDGYYSSPGNTQGPDYLYIPADGSLVSNFKVSVKAGAPHGVLATAANLVLSPSSGLDRPYGTALATTRLGDASPPDKVSANLRVSLETPLTVAPGSDVTTKVTVHNDGPDAAGPTQTVVLLPGAFTLKDGGGGSASNGFLGLVDTFTTPDLAPNASVTYTVKLTTPPSLFVVGFSAAYAVPTAADPNLFNNIGFGLTVSF